MSTFARTVLIVFVGLGHAFGTGILPHASHTPPMGWNSWNHFGCNISESTVLSAAEAIVATGLKDVGYEYVIIDDCWHAPSRDNLTRVPLADPVKFPSGIKHLADAIHSLGLKFGIYSDAGTNTCGGRFGSLGYEDVDAKTYAEWGIDYLKYDNCFNAGQAGSQELSYARYAAMANALQATDRPIHYAICNWGEDQPWEWASDIANSWRISGDIYDAFTGYHRLCPCEDIRNCTNFGHHCSVTRIIDWAAALDKYAGPITGWNDLDMLEVGNGNMTHDEYVSHFSMWALLKSPLILGNDLTRMSLDTFSIVTNKEIIAVNQDALGLPAKRISKVVDGADGTSVQVWLGPLSAGDVVLAVLNASPRNYSTVLDFSELGLPHHSYTAHDLWAKQEDGSRGRSLGINGTDRMVLHLRPHQTKVWRLRPDDLALTLQGQ